MTFKIVLRSSKYPEDNLVSISALCNLTRTERALAGVDMDEIIPTQCLGAINIHHTTNDLLSYYR